ncbi:SpoIIE family protein phosphatase [Pseudonocardia broussonetiae]|uniref:SpoIIE family protein phosphatase n=1 Tax=Pseudonocardia broussonetiae TaxID=2736640 RepID=A0A6M6JFU0_9PSEU|nr:SpoIIE family protein phosphatase [Pseudonocardia broussonetiae]QJY45632.1 SpoIIE family protein phosphatase [Pseudonocardia broussonetiae]
MSGRVPVGTIVLDGDGLVRAVDAGAAEVLQRPEADVVGTDLHRLVHGDAHGAADCPVHRALARGRAERGVDVFRRPGGTSVAVRRNVEPALQDGRVTGAVVVVDTGAPTDDPAARDRFLAGLERALQPLEDADEIMSTVARLLGEHLAVDRSAYAEAEADADHFTMTGSYARGLPPLTGRFAMSQFGAETLRLMRAGDPYVVSDASTDPRVRPDQLWVYEQTGIVGVVCLPLHKGGRFVAAMAVHQASPRLWTAADVELLTTVVTRCWESLQRAHALATVRESEQRYRMIVERASDGIWLCDEDQRYVDANDAACALLGYSRAELLELRVSDVAREEDGERLRRLLARLGSGEPVSEVWELRRRDGALVPVELSIRSAGHGLVQAIGRDITQRRRAEAERERLLAREREANRQLRLLQRATAALSGATTPQEVLDVALDHAGELGADAAVVLSPRAGRWEIAALRGPEPAGLPTEHGADHPLARAVRTGLPVWDAMPQAVPVVVAGRAVAVLGLWSAGPGLDNARCASVRSVTEQCAQALDRARLHQAEHEVAEVLQRSLLPAALPALDRLVAASRYTPSAAHARAGGDWFEMLPVGPTSVALVVGDVVGHGPTAAAVMGQLRSALAAILLDGASPADALERLDAFAARVAGSVGSTCACLVLDWESGELVWALAGHPPVLVVDGGGARLLDDPAGRGTVLGVRDRAAYGQARARIEPGASLVLYTDGLVERRGEDVDDGLARLRAAAAGAAVDAPRPLVAALVRGLLGDEGPADDVALLVVRRVPAPLVVELPAAAASMRSLRGRIDEWAGLAGLPEDDVDDLQLVVGEAAANAAEHAYPDGPGSFTCVLARDAQGGVRVRVSDRGRWRPVPADNGHRGHGLRVMDRLTEGMVLDRRDSGTTVLFRVPPGPEQPGRPPAVRPAPPAGAELSVERRTRPDDRPELVLRGDLDVGGRDRVSAALREAGEDAVVDLTRLRYLSSAGVALLAGAGGRVSVVVAEGSAPARVLALTGLDAALTVTTVPPLTLEEVEAPR